MPRKAPNGVAFLLLGAFSVAGASLAQDAQRIVGKTPPREHRSQTSLLRVRRVEGPEPPPRIAAAARSDLLVNAFAVELEPNDTPATANPLSTTSVRLRGDSYAVPLPGAGDVDVYSFTAGAGNRLYAAVLTGSSAGSDDTILDVIASDGTTVLESDDDDGALTANASSLAGVTLSTAGTYYLRVRPAATTPAGTIRPYELYVRVASGSPTAEREPNNGFAYQPIAASGWMRGAIGAAGDNDNFGFFANSCDTIVAILDVDPERDRRPEWNGRVGIGRFKDDLNSTILVADGSGVGGPSDDANPSEAIALTVGASAVCGVPTQYHVYVDEAAAGGAAADTYNLMVAIFSGDNDPVTINACTGTTGPFVDGGTQSFTCRIPGSLLIDNLRLRMSANHDRVADLDVSLISHQGNEVVLLDDLLTPASPINAINFVLEEDAAVPVGSFDVNAQMLFQSEAYSRLSAFKGTPATNTWTLRVRDDTPGSGVGSLNSWGLGIVETARPPGCIRRDTIFYAPFDDGANGFTHSGAADEWERGLPSAPPIATCHSKQCWKTDLDSTYDAGSTQELVSPGISLPAFSRPFLSWWQMYQFEDAAFDAAWVEVRIVGDPASARKVWEWTGATPQRTVGAGAGTTVRWVYGWAMVDLDISAFAGNDIEVRFHLQSDGSEQLAGWAVDSFDVYLCSVPVELLSITVE